MELRRWEHVLRLDVDRWVTLSSGELMILPVGPPTDKQTNKQRMCAERYSNLRIITKVNDISPVVMINERFEVWRVRFE